MSKLLDIREAILDEVGCHGAYVSLKQSRSDPRLIVQFHQFILDTEDDLDQRVSDVVSEYSDLDVEITEL